MWLTLTYAQTNAEIVVNSDNIIALHPYPPGKNHQTLIVTTGRDKEGAIRIVVQEPFSDIVRKLGGSLQ